MRLKELKNEPERDFQADQAKDCFFHFNNYRRSSFILCLADSWAYGNEWRFTFAGSG